jgi:hypothetical protein
MPLFKKGVIFELALPDWTIIKLSENLFFKW